MISEVIAITTLFVYLAASHCCYQVFGALIVYHWGTNVTHLNCKKLFDHPEAFYSVVVYSDASRQGYGGYIISGKQIWSVRVTGKLTKLRRAPIGEDSIQNNT